jgi:hypothetical protein
MNTAPANQKETGYLWGTKSYLTGPYIGPSF